MSFDPFAALGGGGLALEVGEASVKEETRATFTGAETSAPAASAASASSAATATGAVIPTSASDAEAAVDSKGTIEGDESAKSAIMEERIRFFICENTKGCEMKEVEKLIAEIHAQVTVAKKKREAKEVQAAELLRLQHVRCPGCGNNNPSLMTTDPKEGTTVCNMCGMVVQVNNMNEGAEKRNFEGETDKNHHGPARNPLMSESYNLSTKIGGSAALYQGRGRGLVGTQQLVDLNHSQFGKNERHTREGYKENMKIRAFSLIEHCARSLQLHEHVVLIAKEMFAVWRDLREAVTHYKMVLAACIIKGYRDAKVKARTKTKTVINANGKRMEIPVEIKAVSIACPHCGAVFGSRRELELLHQCPKCPKGKKRSAADMAGGNGSRSSGGTARRRRGLGDRLALPAKA